MSAYYNEHDAGAAAWLRELIREGHIAPGDVDERSIGDVSADDLRGYVQCHFFAGIGIWSHALRRAGWEDDRPVWTGSCPCQPFSAAGKGLGFEDPRHLWPDFLRLIAVRRPDSVFGEQAATAGAWIDLVRSDLEALGYAFGSPDLPAAGFGGAHIRQRLYWVADADYAERWADCAPRHVGDWPQAGRIEGAGDAERRRLSGWVGHPDCREPPALARDPGEMRGVQDAQRGPEDGADLPLRGSRDGWVGYADLERRNGFDTLLRKDQPGWVSGDFSEAPGGGPTCDWVFCRDGAWRPIESGAFPLVDESPGRVGLLRGYGNALDAEVATEFVSAFLEATGSNFMRSAA